MKILILKNRPLEYQSFPIYSEDGVTPLGALADVEDSLLQSDKPLYFDGTNVVEDIEAKNLEVTQRQCEEVKKQITEQKAFLAATDYLLLKVMDGALPE